MCLLDHDFYGEYELMLSAWGKGVLNEGGLPDMQKPDAIFAEFRKKARRFPKDISLLVMDPRGSGYDYGFTGIDPAFLEKLGTLKELILPDSVTALEITPEVGEILDRNRTLIRGSFGSFAESFAAERGLHFRPSDYVFANRVFRPADEETEMKLVFKRNGSVQIVERITSPGTSVSNTMGGSFYHSLNKDFYLKETAEEIAGRFRDALREAIIGDGRLAAFIEKAAEHGYYTGKN